MTNKKALQTNISENIKEILIKNFSKPRLTSIGVRLEAKWVAELKNSIKDTEVQFNPLLNELFIVGCNSLLNGERLVINPIYLSRGKKNIMKQYTLRLDSDSLFKSEKLASKYKKGSITGICIMQGYYLLHKDHDLEDEMLKEEVIEDSLLSKILAKAS
jgi:hypothetical protein